MRVKEWLVSQGHLSEAGKGRLSLENLARVEKAHAAGTRFDNWPLTNTPAKRAKAIRDGSAATQSKPKPVRTEAAREIAKGGEATDIQEIAPYTHTEATHSVYELVDGVRKARSLREVCNNCRVSLVQCECGHPEIVSLDSRNGHVRVYIVEGGGSAHKGNVWDNPKRR